MPKLAALSPKEELFVAEYLVDKNGSRAFVAAGYSPGRHPAAGAYQLLRKPHIAAALKKAMQAQMKRTLITADANLRVIERLAEKAEGDGDWGPAIRARELIGKHYRSFVDKVELTGKNDGPVEFTEIRRTVVDSAQKP